MNLKQIEIKENTMRIEIKDISTIQSKIKQINIDIVFEDEKCEGYKTSDIKVEKNTYIPTHNETVEVYREHKTEPKNEAETIREPIEIPLEMKDMEF